MQHRYLTYSAYLHNRFGGPVQKLSIDAGFTCPNRDGSLGSKGCSFCNNTFKPDYCVPERSVTNQLREGIRFFAAKKPGAQYLAYFQAYTNTYAGLDTLIALYEEALSVEGVTGLVIGTRPDCIGDDILCYLQDLSAHTYVMVELGIESTLDRTLALINRQHNYQQTIEAFDRVAGAGLHAGGHLILGLPGETQDDLLSHAAAISRLPLQTIKLHQLQILKGTPMADLFFNQPELFISFSVEQYVSLVTDFLEQLNPAVVVERFAGVSPRTLLISPQWGLKSAEIAHKVQQELAERGSWQGRLFREHQGNGSHL